MNLPGQRYVRGGVPHIFPEISSYEYESADILIINVNRNPNKIIFDMKVFLKEKKKLISFCWIL